MGIEDMVGDAWEHTSSKFYGFPGFSAYIPTYKGYR
jgi:formylglycine-generating enzyme required for sulfatase activity